MYTCIKILQSVLAIKHSDEQDIHHFQNIRNQSRSLKKRLVHHKEKLSNIEGTKYFNELNLSISEAEIFSALAKIKSE
jgi:hypothetical protein